MSVITIVQSFFCKKGQKWPKMVKVTIKWPRMTKGWRGTRRRSYSKKPKLTKFSKSGLTLRLWQRAKESHRKVGSKANVMKLAKVQKQPEWSVQRPPPSSLVHSQSQSPSSCKKKDYSQSVTDRIHQIESWAEHKHLWSMGFFYWTLWQTFHHFDTFW